MDRRRVLIVGGGVAGLALAPMLARNGVAVEVIERTLARPSPARALTDRHRHDDLVHKPPCSAPTMPAGPMHAES
jgi:2-polyprenyl-6-methoxyphenol hydroxylase-like FAD-dependent oxidoreductase